MLVIDNHEQRRTPEALERNSCSVKGEGIVIGLSESEGTPVGRGRDAKIACLALIRSSGLTASGMSTTFE